MSKEDKITLLDRFAVGFLSALCALFTVGFIFMMLIYVAQGDYVFGTLKILLSIVTIFFILGFVTLDNYFIPILEPAWKFIEKIIKWT